MIIYLKKFILPHLKMIFFNIRRSILYKILKIKNGTIRNFLFDFLLYLLYNLRINSNEKFIFDKENKIYYSRKIRVASHYFSGIEFRINHILNSYLANQIDFQKGDIVFDCGANIGEFSVALNRINQDLIYYCFEPSQLEFEALNKNTNKLNSKNFNIALFNKKGTSEFFEENDSGDSSLFGESLNSIKVNTETIDNIIELYNIQRIKFLKLEAEGAEPEILIGGKKSLKKIEFISVDIGPERGPENHKTISDVNEILIKNGFKLIDLNNKRFVLLFRNELI